MLEEAGSVSGVRYFIGPGSSMQFLCTGAGALAFNIRAGVNLFLLLFRIRKIPRYAKDDMIVDFDSSPPGINASL
jgi:hypothetical protein